MSDGLTRFLGDTPGRVILRLAFLSLVVGVIMAAFNIEPLDLVNSVVNFAKGLYNAGFETIRKAANYLIVGALIVVPLWLLSRILKFRR